MLVLSRPCALVPCSSRSARPPRPLSGTPPPSPTSKPPAHAGHAPGEIARTVPRAILVCLSFFGRRGVRSRSSCTHCLFGIGHRQFYIVRSALAIGAWGGVAYKTTERKAKKTTKGRSAPWWRLFFGKAAWRLQEGRPVWRSPHPLSAPGRPTAFSKQLRAAVLCLVCGA